MFQLAVKNLAANAIRLALTALAIVLGVGFVISSFVLRDGLKDSFSSLSNEIAQGTDLEINALDENADPLTTADLDIVNALPGVRTAAGVVGAFDNSIQPIKPDGSTIPTGNGPPLVAFSWVDDNALNPNTIETGRAPAEADEWVIDLDAAANHGFAVGESYTIITPAGSKTAELVGTFRFAEDNTTNGATLMGFETQTAREYFVADADNWNRIGISIDGSVPVEQLRQDVALALGNGPTVDETGDSPNARVEIMNEAEVAADIAAGFNQFIDVFGWALLGFALISLFVSIFIIANTFSIVIGQRIRELGLLRAIGATPAQVRRSVLLESFVIGVIASAIGIATGVGIAFGIRALLRAINIPLPAFDVILSPTTIALGMGVGIIVTMASAIAPAIAASRTSPISAISGLSQSTSKSRLRYAVGTTLAVVGGSLLAVALFLFDGVQSTFVALGIGAASLFVGVTLLAPLAARPLSRILGAPLGPILGTPGDLSKENAARNPRRTASTAAALMIGLSLVSMSLVLGSSLKTEIDRLFDSGSRAEFFVNTQAFNIPDEVVDRLDADPMFSAVTGVRLWGTDLENVPVDAADSEPDEPYSTGVAALDFAVVNELFNAGVTEGDLTVVDNDSVAVSTTVAEDLGLGLGDTVKMRLEGGEIADLSIVALFSEDQLLSPVLITVDRYDQISDQPTSDYVAAKIAPGVSVADADARFAEIGEEYPSLQFQSAAEARASFSSTIDAMTNTLTALLGLAILIAFVGIANTMALSVFERTREIGLLRAVGMTRRQARRMIRWEAAIISGVGAIMGAGIGLVLGILIVQAIPSSILSSFSIPWARVLVMVAIASAAGLLAALLPAFRSSRMNVLAAIAEH